MQRLAKVLLSLFVLIVGAFALLRTPDTDPAEMRAKYADATSQFVALADGTEVHLRDEGPRDGMPIVLLHGSNADLSTWDGWAEDLREGYRVIRFDQAGHGLTGAAGDLDYTVTAYVEDIREVADELGLERFVLGGNSMGGHHALAFAMAYPERVAGIVLVDAGGAPYREESDGNLGFKLAAMPGVREVAKRITPRSLVERSLSQSVSNQAVVTDARVDRYWEMLRYPGNRDATIVRFARGWGSLEEADLAVLEIPTLILWGEEDRLIPVSVGRWYADTLPQAQLIVYPAIGHLPQEETAMQSVRDLNAWLVTAPLGIESRP